MVFPLAWRWRWPGPPSLCFCLVSSLRLLLGQRGAAAIYKAAGGRLGDRGFNDTRARGPLGERPGAGGVRSVSSTLVGLRSQRHRTSAACGEIFEGRGHGPRVCLVLDRTERDESDGTPSRPRQRKASATKGSLTGPGSPGLSSSTATELPLKCVAIATQSCELITEPVVKRSFLSVLDGLAMYKFSPNVVWCDYTCHRSFLLFFSLHSSHTDPFPLFALHIPTSLPLKLRRLFCHSICVYCNNHLRLFNLLCVRACERVFVVGRCGNHRAPRFLAGGVPSVRPTSGLRACVRAYATSVRYETSHS